MPSRDAPDLDAFDRSILALYQHDTRAAAASIGDSVGLSAAAVQRRLKRLRAMGVVEAELAQLSTKALGFPVTCLVGVELAVEAARELERFKSRITGRPEVQQCYYVTGESDFILVVLAPSMEAYEAFTREALLSDPNVRGFTTHVVLERVKAGVSLPIQR
jgi:DNA-binding Lrp family transcriptional regulator